jgi:hypothetical protein
MRKEETGPGITRYGASANAPQAACSEVVNPGVNCARTAIRINQMRASSSPLPVPGGCSVGKPPQDSSEYKAIRLTALRSTRETLSRRVLSTPSHDGETLTPTAFGRNNGINGSRSSVSCWPKNLSNGSTVADRATSGQR